MRPLEGAAYSVGRVAVIDSTGPARRHVRQCFGLRACGWLVRPVRHSRAGTAGPNFTDAEMPAGALNGSNASFTLSAVPMPASSVALYRNGVLQKPGLGLQPFRQQHPVPDGIHASAWRYSAGVLPRYRRRVRRKGRRRPKFCAAVWARRPLPLLHELGDLHDPSRHGRTRRSCEDRFRFLA